MINRVLVLQLKRIGDFLLTTPALVALRESNPDAEIILCGGPVAEALAPALPMVNEVLAWKGFFKSARCVTRSIDPVYSHTLDYTGTDRSAVLTALSTATVRRSFTWLERKGWRAKVCNDLVESSVRERHTVDHYLDLLTGLATPPENPPHAVLELPETSREAATRLLTGAGVTGPYLVVHPGSARSEKHWSPQKWGPLLARMAAEYPGQIILTGTSDPAERLHLEEILAAAKAEGLTSGKGAKLVDLAGKTPILTLATVIAGAESLIGVDSAAIHFSGAANVPSLSLYGPTNPYHWRVRAPNAWVVQAGNPGVTPESAFAPKTQSNPMEQLALDAVWDGVTKVLPAK